MTTPSIISVAITGSLPTKKMTPAVPITVAEQIESTQEAYEAGASLVHIHVRNDDGSSSSNPDRFREVQLGIEKHCPGMIIQFSTGGRGRDQNERGAMLFHRPDMASLATGSVNFPSSIYENPPDFIEALAGIMIDYDIKPEVEVFDIAMLYNAAELVKRELLKPPVHLQFVLGIKNAMPVRKKLLQFLIEESEEFLPDSTWTAAGVGRFQFEVNQWALELGGHCRTGLEDNIKIDANTLAASNAELVQRIVDIAADYDRHPASTTEARTLLGLT